MNKQIVLDIETTGFNTKNKYYIDHKIIEIGAIEIKKRKITNNIFHKFINPCREIEHNAYKIHGITNKYLINKPIFSQISNEFINFIKNSNLIIHNSKFDIGFIENELKLINYNIQNIKNICNIIDTLYLARKMFPGKKNDLNSLCERYKINTQFRNKHGALIDAKLLAKVFLAMTRKQQTFTLEKTNNLINLNYKKNNTYKKPIIYTISKSEINKHLKYLNFLKKKNNKCLWKIKN